MLTPLPISVEIRLDTIFPQIKPNFVILCVPKCRRQMKTSLIVIKLYLIYICRFCPSVFLFLTAVIPGLWLLQFDLYNQRVAVRDANGWEECANEIFNDTGLSEIQGVSKSIP